MYHAFKVGASLTGRKQAMSVMRMHLLLLSLTLRLRPAEGLRSTTFGILRVLQTL